MVREPTATSGFVQYDAAPQSDADGLLSPGEAEALAMDLLGAAVQARADREAQQRQNEPTVRDAVEALRAVLLVR